MLDLKKYFPTRFYAGENGVSGGSVAVDDGHEPESLEMSNALDTDDLPKEFAEAAMKNDPELREIEDRKAVEKAAKNVNETRPAKQEPVSRETPNETSAIPDGKEKSEKTPDATGEEPEFENLVFKDDVIPGIKGEALKKMGPEAATALGEFHEKFTEIETKHRLVNDRLENLLKDPVISDRVEMLKSGKVEYPVRQITAEERNNAIQLLQVKLDLLPEEAAQAFDLLKSGFETVAKDIAQSHIKNGLMTEQSKRENKKMVTEARSVFLKFGQFNKNLQFKETDPNKFWIEETNEKGEIVNRLNEKHPEVEGFKKYMLPVMEALVKSDIRYSQILKMAKEFGEDAVYTFAAKKLGLPVAINTEDRDKKLLNSGVRKALKPFLAGNASEELPVDGSGKIPGARKDKASNDSGIDINRLIDDEQYYDSVMRQKPGDLAHADYVSELADKALRLRRKQGK